MNDLIKFLKAILFIMVVGSILLISDLSNRKNISSAIKGNFRIAIVHWNDSPASESGEDGILKGLKDKGLIKGGNLEVSVFKASGDISILNSIFKQIESQNYDLLFTSCTPALQTAINITKSTPVIFILVADPVLAGAGIDKTHHNHNVTGCSVKCDFNTMCKLISENAPQIKTLGSVFCPGEIISVKFKDEFTQVAEEYGLNVKFFPANNASELPDAVLSMTSSDIDAVCQMGDNLMSSGISTLIKGVVNANIPYFEFNSRPPGSPMESLIQLTVDYFRNGYDAAALAARILLDGKNPGDIPFQDPSNPFIEINPDKAIKYNITFSDELIQNAHIVVGEKELFTPSIRTAMVHYIFSPDCDDVTTGILQRFKELGHTRDGDFTFDEYNANGDIATLNDIVKVVADKKYDIIFTTVLATTQALSSKIKDTPILFTVVADPVGNGLGKSYSDHIPNLTGIDGMSYTDKGIDLLKDYIPEVRSIGTLYCPGEMASISSLKELQTSCDKSKIELISVPVNNVSEVTDATTMLCMKNIDAICQLPDNITIPAFSSIVKVTKKDKVPLFCFISSQVEMGAIAAIAGDYIQQGKEIADIAIEVINGIHPEGIPFSRIKQIKTVVNHEAAEDYGLKTPVKLLNSEVHVVENKIIK